MRVFIFLLAAIYMFSCNNPSQKSESPFQSTDSTITQSSPGKPVLQLDPGGKQKFIQTADLKFKVNDVIKSTYALEDLVKRHNGYIAHSNLTSQVDYTNSVAISKDSLLERKFISTGNMLELRVPNGELDSTLKDISHYIEFLDHRTIDAENIALKYYANNLAAKRNSQAGERITKSLDENKQVKDRVVAEESVLEKQTAADQLMISNLNMNDLVEFSTVKLNIYQKQVVTGEIIPNDQPIKSYEAGFGEQLVLSAKAGWKLMEAIILFITKLWSVLLLLAGIYLVYKSRLTPVKLKV